MKEHTCTQWLRLCLCSDEDRVTDVITPLLAVLMSFSSRLQSVSLWSVWLLSIKYQMSALWLFSVISYVWYYGPTCWTNANKASLGVYLKCGAKSLMFTADNKLHPAPERSSCPGLRKWKYDLDQADATNGEVAPPDLLWTPTDFLILWQTMCSLWYSLIIMTSYINMMIAPN